MLVYYDKRLRMLLKQSIY